MANYSELLNDINAAIYENNDQEIDALEVRAILREMVTSLGSGFLFKGIATPSSPSGTGTYEPDQNVFYLATTAGTYTYLGGLVVAAGEVAFLCFDGTWTKKSSALISTGSIVDNTTTDDATKPLSAKQGKVLKDGLDATDAEVTALGQEVDNLAGGFGGKVNVSTAESLDFSVTINGKSGDAYYCRLSVNSGVLRNDFFQLLDSSRATISANTPINTWKRVVLPSDTAVLTAFVHRTNILGAQNDVSFDILTEDGMANALRLVYDKIAEVEQDVSEVGQEVNGLIELNGAYGGTTDVSTAESLDFSVTINGESGDTYFCRLVVNTGILRGNMFQLLDSGRNTLAANTPINFWQKVVLPSNSAVLTAFVHKTNILGAQSGVLFEILTSDGLVNRVRALEAQVGPTPTESATEIVEVPSKIFGFAYANTPQYLDKINFVHRLFIEGLAKGNYPDLKVDGGQSTILQVPPVGGAMAQGDYTKSVKVSCKGYEDGNISVPLSLSDPYNLVGKTMRIMHIGDSLTTDGLPCATKAILDVMSTDYGANDTLMVGHIKVSKDVVISGVSHPTDACCAAIGGWAASDFLRHFICTRGSIPAISVNGVLYGKEAWDSLGLGTKTRNGVPAQTYVAYTDTPANRILLRDTPHGYYDADPTEDLWNWLENNRHLTTFTYNGVTYTFGDTYSHADDAAQIAAIKYLCENPSNPFFDIDVVESSNGSYAFSLAKYLSRYKTLADDGVTRLVPGSTAGTKVYDATLYDVCTPTHIVIILAHNSYSLVQSGEGDAEDMATIADLIHAYDSDIKIAVCAPRSPGAFNPNEYNWAGYFISGTFTGYLYNIYTELKTLAESATNYDFVPLYPIQSIFWGGDGKSIDTLDMRTRVRYVGDGNHARSANSYLDVCSEVVAWLAYKFRS